MKKTLMNSIIIYIIVSGIMGTYLYVFGDSEVYKNLSIITRIKYDIQGLVVSFLYTIISIKLPQIISKDIKFVAIGSFIISIVFSIIIMRGIWVWIFSSLCTIGAWIKGFGIYSVWMKKYKNPMLYTLIIMTISEVIIFIYDLIFYTVII